MSTASTSSVSPRSSPSRRVEEEAAPTLSEIARATGRHLSHISRIFSGHRTPSLGTAQAIAKYLGITLDEFYLMLSRIKTRK